VSADQEVRKEYLDWHMCTLRDNARLRDAKEKGLEEGLAENLSKNQVKMEKTPLSRNFQSSRLKN
jgi:hypothetical protein